MADIFQEVDEEVRRDKAVEFWKKYQNAIIAAAVLVVLATAGYRYWRYETKAGAQAAGAQFQQRLAEIEGGKTGEAAGVSADLGASAGRLSGARPDDRGRRQGEQRSDGRDRRLRRGRRRRLGRSAFPRRRAFARRPHPARSAEGAAGRRSRADLAFGRGRPFDARPRLRSAPSRSPAGTMTKPPSNSTSCWATPKLRPTSGKCRAAGTASWPPTGGEAGEVSPQAGLAGLKMT